MRRIVTLTVGYVLLAAAACLAYRSSDSHGVSEKFQRICVLKPGGTVSLQNVNGNLTIKTWDKNEVMIDAVKYADNQEELANVVIEVDTTSGGVYIETKFPDDRDPHHGHGGSVNYSLTVPKNAVIDNVKLVNGQIEISGVAGKVEASTVNGAIHADGLRDGCDIETVNGKLDAAFVSLPAACVVKLRSVNGGLVLRLPGNVSADIDASVTTGHISNEFGLESSRESDRDSFVVIGDELHGKIGGGGASVRLKTVNGSIKILKSASSH